MKFDLNKCEKDSNGHWICQTRDGRKARVICANRVSELFPIVALVTCGTREIMESYSTNGRTNLNIESRADLVNLPRKVKRWVNVYPGYTTGGHCSLMWMTEAEANAYADKNRVACVPIEWEEQ